MREFPVDAQASPAADRKNSKVVHRIFQTEDAASITARKRLLLLSATLSFLGFSTVAGPAAARVDRMTWTFQSDYKYQVGVTP